MYNAKSQYLEAEKLEELVNALEERIRSVWNYHLSKHNTMYASYVMEDLIPIKAMNRDIKAGFGMYTKEFDLLDDMCERYGFYVLDEVA